MLNSIQLHIYCCEADSGRGAHVAKQLRDHGIHVALVVLDRNTSSRPERPRAAQGLLMWSETASRNTSLAREVVEIVDQRLHLIIVCLDNAQRNPLLSSSEYRHISLNGTDEVDGILSALGLKGSSADGGHKSFLLSLNKYREAILESHGFLRILGEGEPKPLADVYLPLRIKTYPDNNPNEDSADPAKLLIEPGRRHIVLGAPGSGKSTLIKYLCYLIASSEQIQIPVPVRAAELMATPDSLETHVTQKIRSVLGKTGAETIFSNSAFGGGATVILIDGFDEVSPVDADDFRRRLNSFDNTFPKALVVLTSRISAYDRGMLSKYRAHALQPLTPNDIESYVNRTLAAYDDSIRDRVLGVLKSDSRLSELSETPFLLAMMCAAPDAIGSQTKQRTLIYERCTKYLLRIEDWEQDSQPQRKRPGYSPEVLEKALRLIAVRFFKLDSPDTFSKEEVLFALKALSRPAGVSPESIVTDICGLSGLLQDNGTSVEFMHRSVWEYFTAAGMHDEPLENIIQRANSRNWEEPIRMYVGLASDRSLPNVLKSLWRQSKGLALRSMTERAEFPSDVLQNLLAETGTKERSGILREIEGVALALGRERDRIRVLADTSGPLLRYERDCQVIYECIQKLRSAAQGKLGERCRDLIESKLDVRGSRNRRQKLIADKAAMFEFVRLNGGDFILGCDAEDRTEDERPAHTVSISPFWIMKFPVTNRAYYSSFEWAVDRREVRSHSDRQPVIYPNWYEAKIFAWSLGCDLPTEAQWEYACRAGGRDDEILSDRDNIGSIAWYAENSDNITHEVGLKDANSFGLHDMLGNVREWCEDWFSTKYYHECSLGNFEVDPSGPQEGTHKVLRGGCFDWNAKNLVSTYRNYNVPDNRYFANGFRLVFQGADPAE